MSLTGWSPVDLALFFGVFVLGTAAIVMVSGFLPLSARRAEQRGAFATLLLALAGLALLFQLAAALRFAWLNLPWAGAIIAGGLGVLAGPLLFQILPRPLRDGVAGLVAIALLCGSSAMLLLG